ncbi:O-antigen ligase family protein [Ideonella oryzae]|uniref:O-antigen ligase family protein n=1 Tax=Ideonella oryzae TaxID=2937441 RepID=A0ABT1BP28_9BURK|nr:O-antigen ligase family protein [Ideonella oryzae]MCO5977579.1 O-antigen ligase family protein [Ideonella oryzae]
MLLHLFTALYAIWLMSGSGIGQEAPYNAWRLGASFWLLLAALSLRRGALPLRHPPTWALTSVLVMLVIGCIHSSDPHRSALELALTGMWWIAGLALWLNLQAHPRSGISAGWVMALTPLPTVAVTWAETWTGGGLAAAQFSNIRLLDDYLLAQAVLLPWLSQQVRSRGLHVLTGIVLVMYVATWFKDGARADLLAFGVGAWIWGAGTWRRPWLSLGAAGLTLSVIGLTATALLPSSPLALDRATTSGRIELLQLGWRYLQTEPLWGIGGQGWGLYDRHNPLYADILRTDILHPHNLYLQWMVEWGLAGWLLLVLLGWRVLPLLWKARHDHAWAVGACGALAINAMFSGAMVYPHTQLAYIWVLALAASHLWPKAEGAPPSINTSAVWRWTIAACTLLFGVTLGWSLMPGCTEPSTIPPTQGRIFPRFWVDGRYICLSH